MKNEYYSAGAGEGSNGDASITDMIHYYGSWIWRAVEALASASDFNSDPKWIANRLNITSDAANDAIEGLIRIGLLKEVDGKLVNNSGHLYMDNKKLDRSDIFQIHNKIKNQITEKMTSRDSSMNTIILSNNVHIKEFYRKLTQNLNELHEKSSADTSSDTVYAIELSLAKLSRER